MKKIPDTRAALMLRTDFSDEAAWQALCTAIEMPTPINGFEADVEFVSDTEFDGITVEQVLADLPSSQWQTFLFIVDRQTITDPEHPILVVDLYDEPGRTFRVIPSAMWDVENNLTLANVDFEIYVEDADSDGVYRGFEA